MFDSFKNYIKEHKNQIIAGTTIVVGTIITGIISYNIGNVLLDECTKKVIVNKKTLNIATTAVSDVVKQRTYKCGEYIVDQHMRKLHEGWNHSIKNAAKAMEYGITNLPAGYSFIPSFSKNKI